MMLGINDIAVYGIDGAVENYGKLMDLSFWVIPFPLSELSRANMSRMA